PIAGLPPVLKPIRLKAKFVSSLLKFRLHRFLTEDFLRYGSVLPIFPFRHHRLWVGWSHLREVMQR
ncbi:MAG: hypothetical protein ABI618_14290, partial [Nitrospirota bacterium]